MNVHVNISKNKYKRYFRTQWIYIFVWRVTIFYINIFYYFKYLRYVLKEIVISKKKTIKSFFLKIDKGLDFQIWFSMALWIK